MNELPGRTTVSYLLQKGRLETITDGQPTQTATAILERAQRRILTAEAALDLGDPEGAFAASYDSYRMAAEALLASQGLRATGGDGSHVSVEDAVSSQFGQRIEGYSKVTFERFRRTRHTVQYFDSYAPEVDRADAQWAVEVASSCVAQVRTVLANDPPGLYEA